MDNDPGYFEDINAYLHPTQMSVPVNLSALTLAIGQLPSGMDVPVRVVGGCAVYVDGPTPSSSDGLGDRRRLPTTKVSGVSICSVQGLMETCVENRWVRVREGRLASNTVGALTGDTRGGC